MKSKKEIGNILLGMMFNLLFIGMPVFGILDMRNWETEDLILGIGFIVFGCLYISRIQNDIEVLEERVKKLENKK